jgi:hypothetical protein
MIYFNEQIMDPLNQQPMPDVSKKINYKVLVIGIITLFVILGGIWVYFNIFMDTQNRKIVDKIIDTAPQGLVVNGFPKNLILAPDANISLSTHSTRSNTPIGNVDYYETKYTSIKSTFDLRKFYLDYFNQNGYNIIKTITSADQKQSSIFASIKQDVILVKISEIPTGGREVYVNLTKQGQSSAK